MLRVVWRGRFVSNSTIRGCIREIRQVLQDSASTPRYIETVGKKGYRFIGRHSAPAPAPATTATTDTAELIVGRDQELEQLGQRLAAAVQGRRQLDLISGEAGLGKTSLAELFVQDAGMGNSLLFSGQIASARDHLDQAIHSIVISRRQQSRTVELRATLCLSRLWLTQGKHRQAQRMLQTVYDRFSEGFDRPDLCRARALLDNIDYEG